MNVQTVDGLRHPFMPVGTSGDGIIRRARDWVVFRIGGTLATQGTTSAETHPHSTQELTAAEQTNTGTLVSGATSTPSDAIAELRRRSGLTWDQLARLLGVARRSVHFWASGKALNAANEERLGRLVAVVRYVDRGSASATRAALLTALIDGVIPFDLLASDKFEEVKERLGPGLQRSMVALPGLSSAARAERMPPAPSDRVGSLHDTIHREVGKSRNARTARIRRTR